MTAKSAKGFRSAPVTWSLIAANLGAGLITASLSEWQFDIDHMVRFGADVGVLTLGGQWWRLVTSLFLHFGPLHLLSNMYCLAFLGFRAERIFGSRTFLAAYLLSGLAGNVLSVVGHPAVVSAGASGAVFGAAGLVIPALLQRSQGVAWTDGPPAPRLLLATLRFVAYNLAYSFVPGVDALAHFGGFGAGIVLGFALRSPQDVVLVPRRLGLTLGGAMVVILTGFSTGRIVHRDLLAAAAESSAGDDGGLPLNPFALPQEPPKLGTADARASSDSVYQLGLSLFNRARAEADRGARDSAKEDFLRVLDLPSDYGARMEGLLMAARHLADSLSRR